MLLEYLHSSQAPAIFLIDGEGEQYSRRDLGAWVLRARELLPQLCRANVALAPKSNLELILLLLLCDGLVDSLLIIPDELSQSGHVSRYTELAGSEYLLSMPYYDKGLKSLPVFKELKVAKPKTGDAACTAWIIMTSGTTSDPKLVSHTLESLSKSTKKNTTIGANMRWGLLYDVSRFAGLQVFLQSLMGGASLIVPHAHSALSDTLSILGNFSCNALSATPTLWRKILMSPEVVGLDFQVISMGGEIADQTILDALTKRYPHARIRHIYASTEAGVGFAVADGKEGFPSAWLKKPPKGIELAVTNEGTLSIRKESVIQIYLASDDQLVGDDGWIDTGDVVDVRRGRVVFLGRKNGTINVGGNKVQPQEVEAVVLSVPRVAMVQVKGVSNSLMGNLVEALIVSDPNADLSELRKAVMQTCRAVLANYKVPAIVTFVENLDVNASGKISRSI